MQESNGMEIESQEPPQAQKQISKSLKRLLLVINFALLVLGATGAPLTLRVYFLHGGSRKWLSSWVQTAAFPVIFLPLSISYFYRRRKNAARVYTTTPSLFVACAVIGLITGIYDLLYAYGVSYLPISTSSILISTQLGFTALFALLMVRQKFTAYSINAVVLLIVGAVLLALQSNGDRPTGETRGQYYLGFFMTLGAAILYGLLLPLVELTYARAKQAVTYTLVMEMQLVMGFFATAFCTVGMLINKDFKAISREAREFDLGGLKYYLVLACSAILWQFFFLGSIGAIFYASALLAGIVSAVLIPVTEVLAVIIFHETFTSGKGVALALSVWGFTSYFYGEFKDSKREKSVVESRQLNSEN